MRDLIARCALRYALRRPAPGRIPRTPPKAYDVNSFMIQIGDGEEKRSFMAERLVPHGLEGKWWSGASFDAPVSIPLEGIGALRIEITHFISVYEFTIRDPFWFLVHELTGAPYVRILFEKIDQALFNRRRLVRGDRIEVLRLALEESVRKREFSFSPTSLMSMLYSDRWVFHPDKDSLIRYCSFLLGSLADSGDLRTRDGNSYQLAARALSTIAQFEEDQRRHRDQLIQQWILAVLTFALVIIGVAQAWITWLKG